MVTNDATLVRLKHKIMEETAKLAWEGKLDVASWTTTPWTLMGNRMLAVSPKMTYAKAKVGGEVFILAKTRLKEVLKGTDYEILEEVKGSKLAGLNYESIDGTTCKVYTADFVGEEEGTGIVHCAPAYGEDDYALYLEHENEIEFVDCLDENGYYIKEYADKLHELGVRNTDEHGIQIWVGNKFIAKCMEEKGIIYKIEYIQHEYPFNPRSKERIMYRAFPSWFFDVEGQKQMMLDENENINWFPAYLKHGRFAKNIEAAEAALKVANQSFHSFVSKGFLKKETASRRVSRLAKLVNSLKTAA